jgi:hypothetical protein
MAGLRADLFESDAALEKALVVDSAHLVKGSKGEHVRKVQVALALLLDNPRVDIADAELKADHYGDTTASAVLRYKTERSIINTSYQKTPDDIVGKMTMRALDDEMAAYEAEFGRALLTIVARLDQRLLFEGLTLPPSVRAPIERLRVQAMRLALGSDFRAPSEPLRRATRDGLRVMNDPYVGRRQRIVFAVAPVAAGAGVAILAFLLAIAALIALLLISAVLEEAGKLGRRVSEAIQAVVDTGEAAILENLGLIDRLSAAVDQCQRISLNPTPGCLAAIARFVTQRAATVKKRNELQAIIQQLKNAIGGSPQKLIWKLLVLRAESVAKELAGLEQDLRDTVRDIIRECGCGFIRI